MAKEMVSHRGKVVAADANFITVEIVSQSACGSCHAASLCSLSESVTKKVDVPTPASEFYQIGEEVEVRLRASMGHKAVWLAYALPLVLLVTVIFLLSGFGAGELFSGLCGIGAVALYYLVLYLLRDSLRDQYVFEIKKLKTQ